MPPQKGKVATKGQKQILEENKSTIKFYTIMSVSALAVNLLVSVFYFGDLSLKYGLGLVFCGLVYAACLATLKAMAKPVYSSTNALLDGGTDLNMENGFAENLKDLIILTSGVQTLSLISSYFWFLWLFAPFRAGYMLWVNILAPWFFQAPPEQPEADEKKQKKMERKMRRFQ